MAPVRQRLRARRRRHHGRAAAGRRRGVRPAGVARGLHRTGTALQDLDELFEHRKRGVHTAEAADIAEMDQNTTERPFPDQRLSDNDDRRLGPRLPRLGGAWVRHRPARRRRRRLPDPRCDLVGRDHFAAPRVVDDGGGQGHQLMPTLAFAGGRLMLVFYDLRETKANVFGRYVSDELMGVDAQGRRVRQTIDIRASLGTPGATPSFLPSVRVSDYLVGGATGRAASDNSRSTRRTCRCSSLAPCHSWAITSTSPRPRPSCRPRAAVGRSTPRPRPRRRSSTPPGPTIATCVRPATASGRTTPRRHSCGGRPPACSTPRSRFPNAGRATPDRATRTSTPPRLAAGCWWARRVIPSRSPRPCRAASWCSHRIGRP